MEGYTQEEGTGEERTVSVKEELTEESRYEGVQKSSLSMLLVRNVRTVYR